MQGKEHGGTQGAASRRWTAGLGQIYSNKAATVFKHAKLALKAGNTNAYSDSDSCTAHYL